MLQFEESFFWGEEIDGFYVESEMKRAWAAQLEILAEIDRICKKHNIQYFATAGTLLGAIRHKGFIPWDDDMDITMKRTEYQKFMKVAPKEIPNGWCLACPQLEKTWKMPFGRLINGAGINLSKEHLQRFHGCPYTVGVDIFPMDYLPEDEAEFEVLKILYEHTLYVKQLVDKKDDTKTAEEYEQEIESYLVEMEETLRFKIDREGNIVNQMLVRLEEMSMLYREEESSRVGTVCFIAGERSKPQLKEMYRETVLMPFENIMIPVPIGYDTILKTAYGDYMVPVYAPNHEYPFYKKQKKQVEELLENVHRINDRISKLEEVVEQNN